MVVATSAVGGCSTPSKSILFRPILPMCTEVLSGSQVSERRTWPCVVRRLNLSNLSCPFVSLGQGSHSSPRVGYFGHCYPIFPCENYEQLRSADPALFLRGQKRSFAVPQPSATTRSVAIPRHDALRCGGYRQYPSLSFLFRPPAYHLASPIRAVFLRGFELNDVFQKEPQALPANL